MAIIPLDFLLLLENADLIFIIIVIIIFKRFDKRTAKVLSSRNNRKEKKGWDMRKLSNVKNQAFLLSAIEHFFTCPGRVSRVPRVENRCPTRHDF
jgi:hypothetical protein